jgi:alkylhydroperoxidase family enzyme
VRATWVDPSAAPGLAGAIALSPVAAHLQRYEDAIHRDPRTDEQLLTLCRDRFATLLGADNDATSQVRQAHTDRERVVLEFAEQWLLDPSGMTDEQCAALRSELGDEGAVAFTYGIAVVEALLRTELALGALA